MFKRSFKALFTTDRRPKWDAPGYFTEGEKTRSPVDRDLEFQAHLMRHTYYR